MSDQVDDGGGIRAWAAVYLKGTAMGAADAIPGVSGGTIALIVGIYERLVDAIAGISTRGPRVIESFFDASGRSRLTGAIEGLRELDLAFLVVLGLGVLTGVVAVANVVDFALGTYRASTFAFFFGVILASPVVLREEVTLDEPGPLAAGLVGVVLAFSISGLPPGQSGISLPALFLVGAVAISAMVLPGISGSLVLLVLGAYHTMTGAVSDLTRALVDGGPDVAAALDPLAILVVFAAGALIGLLTVARIVSWAIDTHRAVTMTFLVGVMFGALRSPAGEIAASVDAFTTPVVFRLGVAGLIGVIAVLALEYGTGGLD